MLLTEILPGQLAHGFRRVESLWTHTHTHTHTEMASVASTALMPEGGYIRLCISKLWAGKGISAEKGMIDETLCVSVKSSERCEESKAAVAWKDNTDLQLLRRSFALSLPCLHRKAVIKIIKRWGVFVFPSEARMQTEPPLQNRKTPAFVLLCRIQSSRTCMLRCFQDFSTLQHRLLTFLDLLLNGR